MTHPTYRLRSFPSLQVALSLACATITVCTLSAQAPAPLGEPRWMPVDRIQGGRTADALALEKSLLAIIDRVKATAPLNPLPTVFPKATLTFTAGEPGRPHQADMLLGFWPPDMAAVRGGRLVSTGELSHLIVYANYVRDDAFDRTFWKDAAGVLLPQPRQVGEVQGFPVYEGAGSVEVSGILVILPKGRALFDPVTQERFRRFEVADLEKQLAQAGSALAQARQRYEEAVSDAGRAARDKRMADSLVQYQQGRSRTPEQVASRAQELRRMDAEEEARLRAEAAPETNRLVGPLTARLTAARASLAALSPADLAAPACHLPDSRIMGPHPVPTGTAGCQPIVSMAKWYDVAKPRAALQMLSVERYWMSREAVRRGVDRARSPWLYLNAAVVEALDWGEIASTLLK